MNLDKQEAHKIDEFPTKYHMTTGRNKNLHLYCHYVKLGLHRHLERLNINAHQRSHPTSKRSHPKMKKFGEVDKKNLCEL